MQKNLTSSELQTIYNTKFFEVKASATKKIERLLAEVRDEIKRTIKKEKIIFPKEIDVENGKIFRGENYIGLPYLVLDYPKHFSKESVLAFRTMFWWGNFFSCTLHVSPVPKTANYKNLTGKKIHICVNDNPWQYHYKKDNYVLIDTLSEQKFKSILKKNNFMKLSRKIPLKDHKKINSFARESFDILYKSL